MCYDIQATIKAQLKRAQRDGNDRLIQEIRDKLATYTDLPAFHVSGFAHPRLLLYTPQSPITPIISQWGLIPHWVKNHTQRLSIWNKTLNARSETIFEKPAFRDAAHRGRSVLYVDGFYEHHHYRGKTYPFFIQHRDARPLPLAALCSEWLDSSTGELWHSFAIVTTRANTLMQKIHNNPKIKESRMPLILSDEAIDIWLEEKIDKKNLKEIIHAPSTHPAIPLEAYTVQKLRGKNYAGNIPSISDEVTYPELRF